MIDQALPITVTGRYMTGGRYPDMVWVEMSDGKKIAYDIRITQPALQERNEDHVGYRRRRNAE